MLRVSAVMAMLRHPLAWLLCLGYCVILGVRAVNVDLAHVLMHSGPEHSKFGFSVAMHISDGRPM